MTNDSLKCSFPYLLRHSSLFSGSNFHAVLCLEIMLTSSKQHLKISVWNINGYSCKGVNKFQEIEFLKGLVDQDIFCLQETHCSLDNCLTLQEFPRPVHLIRSKSKNSKKTLWWIINLC